MKIKEIFEYEVDTNNKHDIFTIYDIVECVSSMSCPFDDGYPPRENLKRTIEYDNNQIN